MEQYKTIVEALQAHAQFSPQKMAVFAEGAQLNYAQLWQSVMGFAKYLLHLGITQGQCVVMQTRQSLGFIVAYYGTHLVGGIFTPLEKGIVPKEMESYLAQTEGFLLISEQPLPFPRWLHGDSILEAAEEHKDDDIKLTFPEPKWPAELLFTSGSTGKAKGVLLSHTNVVAIAENFISGMKYHPDTLLVVPGPLNHANGIRKISATIMGGSGMIILNGLIDIGGFFKVLEEMPVTALCLPPAIASLLLRVSGDKLGDYAGQIEFVENSTAPLSERDKERLCQLLPHTRLYNNYGLSEAGCSCMYDYNQLRGLKNCIGRETVNAHFSVIGEDGREITSSRENYGRLAISGDMVMMEYWKNPTLTAQVLSNGYFYTTDLGYIEDGYIYMVGRKDDLINVGGYKVSPLEIEEAAMGCEGVEDCLCIGMDDSHMGQVPKLYVVPKADTELNTVSLLKVLREKLDTYKIPRKVELIAEVPRSANGKKRRRLLD